MSFKIGDLVTRKSYNNDILFKIIDINEEVVILKGVDLRLYADCTVDDLTKKDTAYNVNKSDRKIINENIRSLDLNRDEYFYLPGKILHIDAVCSLSKSKEKLH